MRGTKPPSRSVWQKIRGFLGTDDRGWRFLIGLLCTICLALFLHFREVRLEILELNATAGRYIVAQTDFEFPDYEATIILKRQAEEDIGVIYQIDPKQVRQARFELENRLIHSKDWRSAVPSSTFEEMYKAVDQLETLLFEARLTDARTIQVVHQLSLPVAFFYEFIPEKNAALTEDFWQWISKRTKESDSFHSDAVNYIVQFFSKRHWTLEEDEPLQRRMQIEASKAVPEKYTRVTAGTRIIDQGEKVTSRHLAMMQSMQQAVSDGRQIWDPLTICASFLLAFIFVAISALYFKVSMPTFLRSLQQLSLLVCIVILTLIFAKLTELILLKSTSSFIETIRYPIVAPFATVLICMLLSPRIALFAAAFLSIILSVSLAVDHSRFLVLNLITSIVVIISTRNLRKRKEVFTICLKAWISSIPVLFAFALSAPSFTGQPFLFDVVSSFLFLFVIAILVIGLLPGLEFLFGAMTDMTLMEYMDPNNELLQKLAMEVPGTYQHCLVLGNLTEACAQAIGANGLFCRVATLYHDIGKIGNSQFYTENQQAAVNIHQLLTPLESAQVIISHVTDGVALARKYRLPQPFIDIILQHHGTTLVYYFYRKQLELKGGRKEDVDESQFRYPGPKPQTKEAAIVMICDTVEAASRSLEEVNEQTLEEMIDRLVAEKADDGQFDECNITFEELSRVKKTLAKSLLMVHHVRVKYPKRS